MSEFFSAVGRRVLDTVDPSRVEARNWDRLRALSRDQLAQSKAELQAQLGQIERLQQMQPGLAGQVQSVALDGERARQPMVFADRANQTANASQYLDSVTDAKVRLSDTSTSNQLRDRGGTARQILGDITGAEAATRDAFLGGWTDKLISASERQNQLQAGLIRDSWQAGAPKTGIGRFAQELLPIAQIGLLAAGLFG